jgi:Fe-Mn family superoxide dismutase
MAKNYSLPKLPFKLNALEPVISEKQLQIHYEKHHASYVVGTNVILEKIDQARAKNNDLEVREISKAFSFQYNGYLLHTLFWNNLTKPNQKVNQNLGIIKKIKKDFKSWDRFKTEFSKAAISTEGSGWAALVYDLGTDRLIINQIEKHNLDSLIGMPILLALDVFEHAYYLDYQNDRAKYVENCWSIINWLEVDERFKNAVK